MEKEKQSVGETNLLFLHSEQEIENKEALLGEVFAKQSTEAIKSKPKAGVKTHKVVAGETLYRISIKYNVKIETLRKWNGLSKNNGIRSGQSLFVSKPS